MAIVGASEEFYLAIIANVVEGGTATLDGKAPAAEFSIERIARAEPSWQPGAVSSEAAYAALYEVLLGRPLGGKPPAAETILRLIVEEATPLQHFIRDVQTISEAAGETLLLWTPEQGDGQVVVDEVGNVITWANPPVITPLGLGWQQAFNGVNDRGTIPDNPKFSFGNGLVDRPFSVLSLAKAADTAAGKAIVYKAAASNNEWGFDLSSAEVLRLFGQDQSAAAVAFQRISSAAVAIGSWTLLTGTYDGTGGPTAANGAVLYEGAASKASGATNNANYVAMEDLGSALGIGATAAGGLPFSDAMALLLIVGGVLSLTQVQEIVARCQTFFGQTL